MSMRSVAKLTQADADRVYAYQEQVWRDPLDWLEGVLDVHLWSRQAQIAEAVRDHPRVCVPSSNAVGKSFLAACLAIWYLEATCPGYVVITGASWTGIEKVVWPWISRFLARAPVLGGDLISTEWRRGPHWGAFSVSTAEEERIAGFRTEHGVFVIVDEASQLSQPIHDAIVGLSASAGSRVLYIGNPLRTVGPFRDAARSADWHTISISALESPNVLAGEEVIPGLATRKWVAQCRREWGTESAAYYARVLGEFPPTGASSFFNGAVLAEIEARDVREPAWQGRLEAWRLDDKGRMLQSQLEAEPSGNLRLWVNPVLTQAGRYEFPHDHNYVMGIDVSLGFGASNSVISIGDTTSREQVGQWADSNTAPHVLAQVVHQLAGLMEGPSGPPFICWEANGPGQTLGVELEKIGAHYVYWDRDEESRSKRGKRPGWHSSNTAKDWLLSLYRGAMATGDVTLRSSYSVAEAARYVYYPSGSVGTDTMADETTGARENHGDRVIADALMSFAFREMPKAPRAEEGIPVGSFAWRRQQYDRSKRREKEEAGL